MKSFHQILNESADAIKKSITSAIYGDVFNISMLNDPDGSFQCHQSCEWIKTNMKDQWWYKELKFLSWDENKWEKVSDRLLKDNAIKKFNQTPIKELIEDISDFSVNGHSMIKFRGYYIDPYLKSKKVSEKAIQKFGKYWERVYK